MAQKRDSVVAQLLSDVAVLDRRAEQLASEADVLARRLSKADSSGEFWSAANVLLGRGAPPKREITVRSVAQAAFVARRVLARRENFRG